MRILVCTALVLLSGCAASLKFIDQQTGDVYLGKSGSTLGNSGDVHALIDGESYVGEWIYSPDGGGYTLSTGVATASGSGGYATATGTSMGITASAKGDGMLHMKGSAGHAIRCVFTFNSMSDTGIGSCQRNDGRGYDVTIKKPL